MSLNGSQVSLFPFIKFIGLYPATLEEQEIIKTDVETKPLLIEENWENVLEQEAEKGTGMIAESLFEKSREHVSKEEKEKSKSKLWEESTAKVKDKKAGPHRVDKGGKYGL